MSNNDDDLFEDDTPPFHIQIWNFIKAMGRIVWAFITLKNIKAPEKIFLQRYSTCMDCEHLLRKKRCKQCGCFIYPKARLLTERCPLGKWAK